VGNFLGAGGKKGSGDQSVIVRFWETLTQGGPFSPYAIGLGAGTIVAVLLLRRVINKYKLPQMDMLLALIAASAVAVYFGWSIPAADGKTLVSVVGKVPAALPSFHIPEIKFEWITKLLGSAMAISFLGLIEALAVAKSIASYTRQPLDYNRQCLAEGVANLGGGFFQSLPGSGSLTRSSINYQAGGLTRMSGAFSGAIVAVAVLALGPYARFIPKSALAGLLFITAARLIDWKRLGYAMRASKFDAALVLITAFWAIFVSVDGSILIGTAVSILLFVPRASKLRLRELIVTPERVVRERRSGDARADSVLIYDFEGELFFGAAPELDSALEEIKQETLATGIEYLVLRLRRTRNPDVVAMEHIEHFLRDAEKRGVTVLLAGVRPDLEKILHNLKFHEWFPNDRVFPEEDQKYSATLHAVRYAYELIAERDTEVAKRRDKREALYYLV
jgi:sulfate permease, SulP family